MSDDEKRRLALLPEVLPAPTKPERDDGGSSPGPRERTRAHLQRLMSAALLASSATLAGCKEKTGYAVVDPMPVPAGDSGGPPLPETQPSLDASAPDAGDAADAKTDADAGAADAAADADAGARAKKPPPIPTGYRVVDPIPDPAWFEKRKPR
jgi:hypothetical protein